MINPLPLSHFFLLLSYIRLKMNPAVLQRSKIIFKETQRVFQDLFLGIRPILIQKVFLRATFIIFRYNSLHNSFAPWLIFTTRNKILWSSVYMYMNFKSFLLIFFSIQVNVNINFNYLFNDGQGHSMFSPFHFTVYFD